MVIYLFRFFIFSVILLFITSCSSTRGGIESGSPGHAKWSQLPPDKKGPPPHAPAHGYRAKYRYHYYPACAVYFDINRKLYFYLSGDNWRVSAELPSGLRVKLGELVTLELETDKPYLYYKEHQKKYPPGQAKKKNKNKK